MKNENIYVGHRQLQQVISQRKNSWLYRHFREVNDAKQLKSFVLKGLSWLTDRKVLLTG